MSNVFYKSLILFLSVLCSEGGLAMIMSWIFTGMLVVSFVCSLILGNGSALAAAIPEGAQAGFTLALSLCGSICLWTGAGKLMEKAGLTGILSRIFGPFLGKIFPTFSRDPQFAGYLCNNVCANFLGLGNAATPMGIQAAKRLSRNSSTASDELCRLIVLNTASIQLIPTTVGAIRSQMGCASPFDILPAVWVTSICSAGLGLLAAWGLGKVWRRD